MVDKQTRKTLMRIARIPLCRALLQKEKYGEIIQPFGYRQTMQVISWQAEQPFDAGYFVEFNRKIV